MKKTKQNSGFFWALACSALLFPSSAFGGFRVGNGGDLILCQSGTESSFEGFYSLDWLLTFRKSNNNNDLMDQVDWQSSLRKISKRLTEVAPEVAERFEGFRTTILNQDPALKRIWEEASFGLVDLKDEQILNHLPENCKDRQGRAAIVQAVIRITPVSSESDRTIFYKFVPRIFDDLRDRPLQISFLMVHEFLWDVSNDIERNRFAVRYLHSKAFFESSVADARMALQNLGVRIFQKPKESRLKIVDAGHLDTCVLGETSFECWGHLISQETPAAISRLPDPGLWAAGFSHLCSVVSDNVECKGSRADVAAGIDAPPYMQYITSISAGDGFSCATHQEGISCWGRGNLGETNPPEFRLARMVETGTYASCASDGDEVKCWSASTGQPGGVTEINRQKKRFVEIEQLQVSDRTACALDKNNSLFCWGDVEWLPTNPIANVRLAAVGDKFACVVMTNGRLTCFGADAKIRAVPKFAGEIEDITAGSYHVCAASVSELQCWGSNDFHQLDIPASVK